MCQGGYNDDRGDHYKILLIKMMMVMINKYDVQVATINWTRGEVQLNVSPYDYYDDHQNNFDYRYDDGDYKYNVQIAKQNWTRGEVELEKDGRWHQLVLFGKTLCLS